VSDQAARRPDSRPGRPASLPLTVGDPAPWFKAPTVSASEFVFDSAAGRWVLLGFLPLDPEARREALVAASSARALFDDAKASLFLVVRDPETAASARDMRGLRWVLDRDGEISRLFGALSADGVETPMWLLLDPTLRVAGNVKLSDAARVFQAVANLPAPADHAGVPATAPVMIAPRIFDDDLCARLIALHQAEGGTLTGVMRDEGRRTVEVADEHKRRRDIRIADPALKAEIRQALDRRLFPLIKLAFQFQVDEIERYLVSCYDAAEGGVFRPHRDNTTWETAERRFACSINLNDDFDGGALRFPEYGLAEYRPPKGGAAVFSCGLMHEARPVASGRRYAFLPFFYDEAGWRLREDYLRREGARGDP
jgi:predicted 2-oxoglutarate/Fe(II)-dependent dioxygenase YbiX/peroxiredoxin